MRVREQARIQVEGEDGRSTPSRAARSADPPPRTHDGALEPDKGLLALPEPSPGDLFLDLEGDPFALDDGVDYLFGVLEPGRIDARRAARRSTRFWSRDDEGSVTLPPSDARSSRRST